MTFERDRFHHFSDGSFRDTGAGEHSDGHTFSTSPRGPSVFPDNSGEVSKPQSTANKSRNRTRKKPKKLDLTSMLDRCGGDLELLNGVLER
jgi:hypothetical protein